MINSSSVLKSIEVSFLNKEISDINIVAISEKIKKQFNRLPDDRVSYFVLSRFNINLLSKMAANTFLEPCNCHYMGERYDCVHVSLREKIMFIKNNQVNIPKVFLSIHRVFNKAKVCISCPKYHEFICTLLDTEFKYENDDYKRLCLVSNILRRK